MHPQSSLVLMPPQLQLRLRWQRTWLAAGQGPKWLAEGTRLHGLQVLGSLFVLLNPVDVNVYIIYLYMCICIYICYCDYFGIYYIDFFLCVCV